MRALPLALAYFTLLVACSDGGPRRPVERLRSCGELEGVAPLEPVIVAEDGVGCPVFAPVPCTKPESDYQSTCGPDCGPTIATNGDGDAWLVGCDFWPPDVPCGGADFHETYCGVDPFEGGEYWWARNECDRVFVYFWECWSTCDGDKEPLRTDCPQHDDNPATGLL